MTILDEDLRTSFHRADALPRRSARIAAAAHRAIARGGDLEAVLVALLGLGPLVRTDLVLAAITCRDESRRDDADASWRIAAVNLEQMARMRLFESAAV
jgi:hypothetical protein